MEETSLLGFNSPPVKYSITESGLSSLDIHEWFGGICQFARDEIPFGCHTGAAIPTSRALRNGYSLRNTNASLFMALLRASGVPFRRLGFELSKSLQHGLISESVFSVALSRRVQSRVELKNDGLQVTSQRSIPDIRFLREIHKRFPGRKIICSYGSLPNAVIGRGSTGVVRTF